MGLKQFKLLHESTVNELLASSLIFLPNVCRTSLNIAMYRQILVSMWIAINACRWFGTEILLPCRFFVIQSTTWLCMLSRNVPVVCSETKYYFQRSGKLWSSTVALMADTNTLMQTWKIWEVIGGGIWSNTNQWLSKASTFVTADMWSLWHPVLPYWTTIDIAFVETSRQ